MTYTRNIVEKVRFKYGKPSWFEMFLGRPRPMRLETVRLTNKLTRTRPDIVALQRQLAIGEMTLPPNTHIKDRSLLKCADLGRTITEALDRA